MLRFTILRDIGDIEIPKENVVKGAATTYEVALEYNEHQLLSRLQARIRENLIKHERWHTHTFSKDQVAEAFSKAYTELLQEFKDKTVALS